MTKIFKVKGMDCASCASLIEMDLQDAGYKASCSYAKEELVIDDDKIDTEKIKKIVANSGYSLEN